MPNLDDIKVPIYPINTDASVERGEYSLKQLLDVGYRFMGFAQLDTVPETNQALFYFANIVGDYTNFNLSVGEGELSVFIWNGTTWIKGVVVSGDQFLVKNGNNIANGNLELTGSLTSANLYPRSGGAFIGNANNLFNRVFTRQIYTTPNNAIVNFDTNFVLSAEEEGNRSARYGTIAFRIPNKTAIYDLTITSYYETKRTVNIKVSLMFVYDVYHSGSAVVYGSETLQVRIATMVEDGETHYFLLIGDTNVNWQGGIIMIMRSNIAAPMNQIYNPIDSIEMFFRMELIDDETSYDTSINDL